MRFSSALILLVCLVATLLVQPLEAQRRKKTEEEITQSREIFPDPPQVVTAETSRLLFVTSPLSSKGLLSQQVRDGLRALAREARGGAVVKVRGFVAGTGDLRRVSAIVSETFGERRLQLPAVSVIQVGALPLEGAQVVLEGTVVAKKPANPHGLIFLSGQAVQSEKLENEVAPLVARSIAQLSQVLSAAGGDPKEVLRVTCFASSLEDHAKGRSEILAKFPRAVLTYVQLQRGYIRGLVECDAVARSLKPVDGGVRHVNAKDLPASPNYSHAVVVSAPKLALSGLRLGFQDQEADARLAFSRLEKDLVQAHASPKSVVMSNLYPLSNQVLQTVSKVRFEFYDRERPPASTMLLFEGLPSLDAAFGVEVTAVSSPK